jgi:hypothetical protein
MTAGVDITDVGGTASAAAFGSATFLATCTFANNTFVDEPLPISHILANGSSSHVWLQDVMLDASQGPLAPLVTRDGGSFYSPVPIPVMQASGEEGTVDGWIPPDKTEFLSASDPWIVAAASVRFNRHTLVITQLHAHCSVTIQQCSLQWHEKYCAKTRRFLMKWLRPCACSNLGLRGVLLKEHCLAITNTALVMFKSYIVVIDFLKFTNTNSYCCDNAVVVTTAVHIEKSVPCLDFGSIRLEEQYDYVRCRKSVNTWFHSTIFPQDLQDPVLWQQGQV